MSKISAIKSGIRGFANAVKRTAVQDRKFAEELVYMHGIRSEITPKSVRVLTKDMFDKGGKLTQRGTNEITRTLQELNLPQNATWDDIFEALRHFKVNVPKIQRINPETVKLQSINTDLLKCHDAGLTTFNKPKFVGLI